MSSGPSNLGGKSLSAPVPYTPNSQPNSAPTTSFDSSSRRSGLSSPSLPNSAPRKGQGSRRQHRDQRRPLRGGGNLDQDDAMAEIVSQLLDLGISIEHATELSRQRAVRNASSRRGQTSITHLLNYSAPTRPYNDYHRSSRRHPTWGHGSGYHTVDKARFVHANYRFVVSPTANYASQSVDADKYLEWSDVLQIIASAESQTTLCPICLSEPVAPRMARCGHIFCLPCLLRFMNSTNDDEPSPRKEVRWRKCPICEDAFRLAEVKPVRFYAGQENPLPRPGEDVVLRLMVRDAGSTLALPNEGGPDIVNLGEEIPWHFAANVMDYARVMKGTNDYVIEQYDREIDDLRRQAQEDEMQFGIEEGDWTQRAIRAINTAKEKIKSQQADEEPPPTPPVSALKAKQPAGQQFYFYSAPPHLYLSPLDIRILKTRFGDFSNFPSTLLPRVEHISPGHSVDDALRKRAKYLGHLPRGCVVSFLECDWTDIVPADILETFSGDIERRRKLHRDKATQEERERLQAERLEASAIGRATRRHFDQTNGDKLEPTPTVNSEDFQPLGAVEGTSPPNPRPGFSQLANMSTSPSTSKTVWGTPAVPVSPELAPMPELEHDDLLRAAAQAMQIEDLEIEGFGLRPSNGPGGKKKKKQKITLMSTSGFRGS